MDQPELQAVPGSQSTPPNDPGTKTHARTPSRYTVSHSIYDREESPFLSYCECMDKRRPTDHCSEIWTPVDKTLPVFIIHECLNCGRRREYLVENGEDPVLVSVTRNPDKEPKPHPWWKWG